MYACLSLARKADARAGRRELSGKSEDGFARGSTLARAASSHSLRLSERLYTVGRHTNNMST